MGEVFEERRGNNKGRRATDYECSPQVCQHIEITVQRGGKLYLCGSQPVLLDDQNKPSGSDQPEQPSNPAPPNR